MIDVETPSSHPTGVEAMIAYLGDSPARIGEPAEVLAERFGVPVDWVRATQRDVAAPDRRRTETAAEFGRWVRSLGDAARRASDRPGRFFIGLDLGWATLLALMGAVYLLSPTQENEARGESVALAALALCATLNWVVVARHGRVKLAWASAGLLLVTLAVFLPGVAAVILWRYPHAPEIALEPGWFSDLLVVGFLHGLLGTFAAIVGASLKDRRSERARTRADALARIVEIEDALKERSATGRPRLPVFARPWLLRLREHRTASVAGIAVLTVGLSTVTTWATGGAGVAAILVCFAIVLAGLVGGNARAGAVCGLGLILGTIAARYALSSGWPGVFSVPQPSGALLVMAAAGGAVGGLWAAGADRLAAGLRRAAGEPGELIAEMVRLQWKIERESRHAAVMVVDVVGSTELKRNADPLAVEYTFGEYHALVRRVCGGRGGHVRLTAGDGATVEFVRATDALIAARTLQAEIVRFDREVSRLEGSFSVRIGLHAGAVRGEGDAVQYASVVDVAEAAERRAAPGGIVLTRSIAEELEGVELVPWPGENEEPDLFAPAEA